MEELPATQTQEDPAEASQEITPWGYLLSCIPTLPNIELYNQSYTFGRSPECTITVDSLQFPECLSLSKKHFQLTKDNDELVYITDISKNGTFINRVKVGKNQKMNIFNGDFIALGNPRTKTYNFVSEVLPKNEDFPPDVQKKYLVAKKIGQGAFGEVRLAHDKGTSRKYAIKKIRKGQSCSSEGNISLPPKVRTEIDILSNFFHPFIIEMREVFESNKEIFLVLEFMEGGELSKRILSTTPFPEEEVKFIFYQILLAIQYLHLNGVTHRDIKPENVLLYSDNPYPRIKVSDFGLSRITDEVSLMETVCGTINYVAPEVLNCDARYDNKVDVWSLGVLLFFMLSKTQPFTGDRSDISRKILKGIISWDSNAWKRISKPGIHLTKRMMTVDPQERISLSDILTHDWIHQDHHTKMLVNRMLNDRGSGGSSPKRPRLDQDYL